MKVKKIYNKNGSYEKNCPNCGAAIESEKCPYCGTVFIDFACIDADKPFYLKIKTNGTVCIVKTILNTVTCQSAFDNLTCMALDGCTNYIPCAHDTLDLGFTIIDDLGTENE